MTNCSIFHNVLFVPLINGLVVMEAQAGTSVHIDEMCACACACVYLCTYVCMCVFVCM